MVLDDDKIKWHDDRIVFLSDVLKRFQLFWRKNAFVLPLRINELDSSPLENRTNELDSFSFIDRLKNAIALEYDEAFCSVFLIAYLQKVVSRDALVHRQYAQGKGSVDICVFFNGHEYFIKTNVQGQRALEESLEQLSGHLNSRGEKEAWLVIFDKDRNKTWDEKISWKSEKHQGFTIHIVGC
jgi:hypothetical protein